MDHSEAIELRAAERYLLGELSVEQRDQFEEHFFGCLECAGDVRCGAALVDNARHVLTHEPVPIPKSLTPSRASGGWFGWLQPAWGFAAAVIVLAGILSYQNLVTIPSLKQGAAHPQMLATFSLLNAGSRAAGVTTISVPSNRPFGLYIDIPARQSFPYYTVEIRTETGKSPVHVQVSAEQAKDTVQILVPAGVLGAGNSTLIIEGHADQNGPSAEVARYPFLIQYK